MATGVKLELNRIWLIGLLLLSAGLLGGVAFGVYRSTIVYRLRFAAGASTGESYILATALKTVVERHDSHVRITVVETGGTVENLRMLDRGQAQLAVAQADVAAGADARLVAVLYDDMFQLLVHQNSDIQNFADLKGKTIALARTGGQLQSFLRVAEHFGLHEADFRFVGATDAAADREFLNGRADAIFRVRALGNPSIQHLVDETSVRFIPIEHAAAMQIKHPAFDPATMPEGAYRGNPPIPPRDLPAVAVHRLLLANQAAADDAIQTVTAVLVERRQEIMQEIPPELTETRLLLAHVRRPETQAGLTPALHTGARKFYDKDKPSFLLAHADVVGLVLTIVLMVGSWIWELKAWMERQQKNNADKYSKRAMLLMTAAQTATSAQMLDEIRGELLALLTGAVQDLEEDKLSEDSFHSFRSILQVALEVTRESRSLLKTATVH